MKFRLKTDYKSRPPQIFKRGKIFYIRQRVGKKDVWRSLHTTNKAQASANAYAIWFAQQSETMRGILEEPSINFCQTWTGYEKTEAYMLLKLSTLNKRIARWNAFVKWSEHEQGILFINEITPEIARNYLEQGDRKNKTFNNIKNDLKQVFDPACQTLKIKNPFTALEAKSIKRGKKASNSYRNFTDAELSIILNELPKSKMKSKEEWLHACYIAMYTGLRYKDIALLQWTEIHESSKYIMTSPFKTENKTSGKNVIINIVPELSIILNSISKTNFYILPSLAESYDPENATKPFSKFLKSRNINNINGQIAGFHSFRATVVTKAQQAGINLKDFGGVIGHTTQAQTELYNKAAIDIDMSFLKFNLKKNVATA